MLLRRAATVLLAGIAGALLYFCCLLPYRCNIAIKPFERRMLAIEQSIGMERGHALGLRQLSELQGLPNCCRTDPRYWMAEGLAYRAAGEPSAAITSYQKALALDQRPEIYLSLGYAELETGARKEATEHFLKAVRFDPFYTTSMPDDETRHYVEHEVFGIP